jgi:hypothetical protein
MTGCEKFKDFQGMEAKECCETLPEFQGKEHQKECAGQCGAIQGHGDKMSCFTDCALKLMHLLDAEDLINEEAVILYLTEKTSNDAKWKDVIKTTVESCSKEGPIIFKNVI